MTYTIAVSDSEPMDGLSYSECLATYYGEVSPWHATRPEADAAVRVLRTTGDWPDGRPTYRVVKGHYDAPWSA